MSNYIKASSSSEMGVFMGGDRQGRVVFSSKPGSHMPLRAPGSAPNPKYNYPEGIVLERSELIRLVVDGKDVVPSSRAVEMQGVVALTLDKVRVQTKLAQLKAMGFEIEEDVV